MTFGAGLPAIRPWVEQHLNFCGYVLAPGAGEPAPRGREPVCLVTVGGSGVGGSLLRKVIDAYPSARERVPGLRMKVVCGPRIDPATVAAPGGVGSSATSTTSRASWPPATSPSPTAG